MKKLLLVVCALIAFVVLTNRVYADVYATNITVDPVLFDPSIGQTTDISFILNENADNGVVIEIFNGGNVLVRTLTMAQGVKGTNLIQWDGKDEVGGLIADGFYTIKVTASDDGYAAWTKISDDLMTVMYSPKGVAVNKDPTSEYFGKIYIANGFPGTSANPGATESFDGIHMFYPDQTPIGFSDGGVDWSVSSNSPFKLNIGPDNSLYIGDWGHDWLWQSDPEVTAGSMLNVLDDDNKVTGQYINAGFPFGTGADRSIFTADGHYGDYTGIKKYDIGNASTMPDNDIGYQVVDRPNGLYYQYDVEVGSDGAIYFCQQRSSPDQAYPLLKYPAWVSRDTVAYTLDDTLWTVPMSFTGAYGIGLDEPRNLVAYCDRYSDNVYIFDLTTGAHLYTVDVGMDYKRDIAFDVVGNFYTCSANAEYWQIWSPPTGANSYITTGVQQVEIFNSIPVELSSFSAVNVDEGIKLEWETQTETNNSGFAVERGTNGTTFEEIAFVDGHGSTTERHSYSYIDRPEQNGKYFYRLKQVDFDGAVTYSSVVEIYSDMPMGYSLAQNHPNPFNPTTTITYSIPEAGHVTITVFSLLGEKVVTLVDENKESGNHSIVFNASHLASGTYIYLMNVNGTSISKKMILMK